MAQAAQRRGFTRKTANRCYGAVQLGDQKHRGAPAECEWRWRKNLDTMVKELQRLMIWSLREDYGEREGLAPRCAGDA